MRRLGIALLCLLLPFAAWALTRFVSVGSQTAAAHTTSPLLTIPCPGGQGYTASSSSVAYSGGSFAVNMGLIRVVKDQPGGVGAWIFQFENKNAIAVSATVAVVCLK